MSKRPEPTIRLRDFDLDRVATNPLTDGFIQWCVVTPDLDDACEKIEALYGAAGFYVMENGPLNDVKLRGEPIDIRVDMALGYIGDINVEVIRPRPEGDDNIYTEFLDAHPEGGMHHFGFQVHDYDAAVDHLMENAGPIEQEGYFGTGGTRFAYFDTRSTTGLYTELLWFDPSSSSLMASLKRADGAALLE